jgi:hypothetical protein
LIYLCNYRPIGSWTHETILNVDPDLKAALVETFLALSRPTWPSGLVKATCPPGIVQTYLASWNRPDLPGLLASSRPTWPPGIVETYLSSWHRRDLPGLLASSRPTGPPGLFASSRYTGPPGRVETYLASWHRPQMENSRSSLSMAMQGAYLKLNKNNF